MSGAKATVPGTRGMSTLVWPKFEAGMLLQSEDMDLLTSSPRELFRLLFRSLFGCGVICGLVVKLEAKCGKVYVTVGAGLGLDCAGNPIDVPTDQSFALDEECNPNLPDPMYVILCGTMKRCAPRPAMCGCDDDETSMVRTRTRDGFEIRVVPEPPACACGCLDEMEGYQPPEDESECSCVDPCNPCYKAHYAGECGCHCDECSDCNGKCIVLARLTNKQTKGQDDTWKADHSVRRFIRPVLIRDPQVALEKGKVPCKPTKEQEANTEVVVLAEKQGQKSQKAPKPPKP